MSTLISKIENQPFSANKLRKISAYYDIFSHEDCTMGEFEHDRYVGMHEIEGRFTYHPATSNFLTLCRVDGWILVGFDWSGWAESAEAQTLLDDPDALAEADPYDLAKVLTVIWGREHQKNGYIAEVYGNGLLLSVLHRAKTLSATAPF